MKISKIKKTSNSKYNLILDNKEKIVTYDDVILKNNLLFNREIDSELLNKLNVETKYYDIYNKCIKLIGVRLRSEKEINDYLDKNNIEENQKKQIIDNLKNSGLINDKQFTRAFVMDKINFSNNGPSKIRNELRNHEIDENIINEELLNVDESIYLDKIKKIIDKKVRTNTKYSDYILKQKIMSDLINLGFYRDDINSCLEGIKTDNNKLIDREYDKAYKRLSIKYSDKELYQKIKSKLYKSGFSMSEIEEVMNKKIG